MNSLLEHDHEELDGILSGLFTALDVGDIEESFKRLDLFWARLGVHIRAEHLCLFPVILHELNIGRKQRSGDAPSLDEAREAIAQLRADHDLFMHELGSAVKQMRDLRTMHGSQSAANILQDVQGRVAAVSRRLESHNKLEEGQVYKWADKLLNRREQTRLAAKLQQEIENLPPRFSGADADG